MSRSKVVRQVAALGPGPEANTTQLRTSEIASGDDEVARVASIHDPHHTHGAPVARIHQRGRSPMQSGRAQESTWFLAFEPQQRTAIDNLMGWTSTRDTLQQVELCFSTLEDAVAFAKRRNLSYLVDAPRPRALRPSRYADNFRHDRLLPWTH
jgi:hypothetical protein